MIDLNMHRRQPVCQPEWRKSSKLKAAQPSLKEQTLWYRLVTGGPVPRYLRLRPRSRVSAMLKAADDGVLAQAGSMISGASVELLVSQPSLTIDVRGEGRSFGLLGPKSSP
jgi:hypothetical protein